MPAAYVRTVVDVPIDPSSGELVVVVLGSALTLVGTVVDVDRS
jgi:hypothetical protein